MSDRDDGTPRTVRLPLVAKTWGRSCNSEYANDACDFLKSDDETGDVDWCDAFRVALTRDVTLQEGLWVRCPACRDLDYEPDRTPAEAQAHGLGSQP